MIQRRASFAGNMAHVTVRLTARNRLLLKRFRPVRDEGDGRVRLILSVLITKNRFPSGETSKSIRLVLNNGCVILTRSPFWPNSIDAPISVPLTPM